MSFLDVAPQSALPDYNLRQVRDMFTEMHQAAIAKLTVIEEKMARERVEQQQRLADLEHGLSRERIRNQELNARLRGVTEVVNAQSLPEQMVALLDQIPEDKDYQFRACRAKFRQAILVKLRVDPE